MIGPEGHPWTRRIERAGPPGVIATLLLAAEPGLLTRLPGTLEHARAVTRIERLADELLARVKATARPEPADRR